MATRPRRPLAWSRKFESMPSKSVSTRRADSSNRRPSGVRTTLRVLRSNSRAPRFSSTPWISVLNADCDRCIRSAARVKLRSSMSATTARRSREDRFICYSDHLSGKFHFTDAAWFRTLAPMHSSLLPAGTASLLRIGCGAGFSGDRWDAAVPVVRTLLQLGGPAVLMFETLAERTLALAQLQRRHNPQSGWEPTLERFIAPVLADCVRGGIPIVG